MAVGLRHPFAVRPPVKVQEVQQNFPMLPALPESEALSHAADWAHVAVGQWLVYPLILLHVLGTARHVGVRRDGVLDRMLPQQNARN